MARGPASAIASARCVRQPAGGPTARDRRISQPDQSGVGGRPEEGDHAAPLQCCTFRGDTFRIGGNGIKPDTSIRFQAVNIITRAQIDFLPGVRVVETRKAGSNCVGSETFKATPS